jgi:hypothetical protein
MNGGWEQGLPDLAARFREIWFFSRTTTEGSGRYQMTSDPAI